MRTGAIIQARASSTQLPGKVFSANVHCIPVHLQPCYGSLGFAVSDFPNAEEYYERTITLPFYPAMGAEDLNHVVIALERALG